MRAVAVVLLTAVARVVPAPAYEPAGCGDYVAAGQVRVLAADVHCSAEEHYGIYLEERATLELNGFTIRGSGVGVGVQCRGRACRVAGPGAITGFDWGVRASGSSVRMSDVRIADSLMHGIVARRLRLERSSITGCRGTSCDSALQVSARLSASDSAVSDNVGDGIVAGSATLRNVSVTGNTASGVWSRRLRLPGIWEGSGRVAARDSLITGNATACPPDTVPPCVDVLGYRVRLRNTAVGTCSGAGCP